MRTMRGGRVLLMVGAALFSSGCKEYYDATNLVLPPGCDNQMFGTLVFLMPYFEEGNRSRLLTITGGPVPQIIG